VGFGNKVRMQIFGDHVNLKLGAEVITLGFEGKDVAD
jgi:hypothetical protein